MSLLIEISGIHKSYSDLKVLNDISLKIHSGIFYTLLGKNGAGKSTLMRILMRHEAPNQGEGHAFGLPFSGNSQSMNDAIGYVSENLIYSTSDSIATFFKRYGKFYSHWNHELFLSFLKKFNLALDQRYSQLSRGQKMHIAFSAAAAIQPKVLFLDEITSVLDANARSYVMEYLGDFCKKGGSVVLATNIVSEVENYADHLWLIENHKLQIDLPVQEVKNSYVKLRRPNGMNHPIFSSPSCFSVGLNSDGSESFVVPRAILGDEPFTDNLHDRRGITSEDLFVFFSRDPKGDWKVA